MVVSLKELRPSESGVIKSIGGSGPIRRRLMDMGITPGANITMRKVAPLGDPLEINIRGYELSLRKAEAAQVIVESTGHHHHHHHGSFGHGWGRRSHGHCANREENEALYLTDLKKQP